MTESCAECLYKRQLRKTDNEECLAEIRAVIDNRTDDDPAPYLVYQFNQIYLKYFGSVASFRDEKKQYNDLVLSMEDALREKINRPDDPLLTAFSYARAGNYIDFGALSDVDEKTFLSLLERDELSDSDLQTFEAFTDQCETAKSLLLLADNCGEIVLDKLFLELLKKRYPQLKLSVMVRGGEVLNDATVEDAEYAGLGSVAEIISSGVGVSGTVCIKCSRRRQRAPLTTRTSFCPRDREIMKPSAVRDGISSTPSSANASASPQGSASRS